MPCAWCERVAKFHSYQSRRLLTVHGEIRLSRAYYYCARCHHSFIPYDDVLGLREAISPGLLPLLCLAGTLVPFADAAEDVLRRFSGVRGSASTVRRCTEGEGERLRAQLKEGRMVQPTQPEPKWTTPRKDTQPAAYVGLDAFSVPMQGMGAGKAEHRMLYTALLYTPEKEHNRYLVDFDLDGLAEQVRGQARAVGLTQVSDLIAVTDGGNGLEEALQRHLADNLTTILDWYHEALLAHLRALPLPPDTAAEVHEELRKLLGYFENNHHRTDYPAYRQKGWDIGRGPTEAGCKIIGERLKGSGMRWVEDGAATVAALRALYVSGGKVWDGFWSQPHRPAA